MLHNKSLAFVSGARSAIAKSIIGCLPKNYAVIKHSQRPINGCLSGDLADENVVRGIFDDIDQLDLLVCCAGSHKVWNDRRPDPEDCLGVSYADALELFRRNFYTTYLCCKYAFPKMSEGAKIVMIGSAVVSRPRQSGEVAMYGCAKAAQQEYALHLANQLEPSRNRVLCIATDGRDIKKIVDCFGSFLNNEPMQTVVRIENEKMLDTEHA